jgi:hypothetical protein
MESLGDIIHPNCIKRLSTMEVSTPNLRRRLLRLLWPTFFDCPLRGYYVFVTAILSRTSVHERVDSGSANTDATAARRVRREDAYFTQVHVQPNAVVLDYPVGW